MNSHSADGSGSLLCFTESYLKRGAGAEQDRRHVGMTSSPNRRYGDECALYGGAAMSFKHGSAPIGRMHLFTLLLLDYLLHL